MYFILTPEGSQLFILTKFPTDFPHEFDETVWTNILDSEPLIKELYHPHDTFGGAHRDA